MQLLRLSTVTTIPVGPVLDSAGLAVITAVIGDFSISKNGTNTALAAGATATSIGNGMYNIALIAGNVDTAGRLLVFVNNTAMSMGPFPYTVLLASVFDAMITNEAGANNGLMIATATERNAIAAALLDLVDGVESTLTLRQALRAIAAMLAGNVEGAQTASEIFRACKNAGTTRITNAGDASGNRTITTNL